MRENRTSGSEGGGTEQSVLPTPILKKAFYYVSRFARVAMFSTVFIPNPR